jgi:hypothetical protein
MELIVTSQVGQRMKTISQLVNDRAEVFRKVEEAQLQHNTPEMESHFGQWRELTQQIEQLQKAGA